MKKYIFLSIIIILIASLSVGYFVLKNRDVDSSLKTIKVNEVTRSVFYAPQYVAISKGFFEEEGLSIELTTGQGADAVMTAVLANQSDIGFAGPEASIYVYNEGKEDHTEVFAQLTKKDGSFLVSKVENPNFTWQDLKGKTVIPGRKGGVPYMTLEYVIKKNGLNPSIDLVLDDSIKFDLMAGAFTGGEADYVTLFEPTASLIQNSGKGYIVASVGEAAGDIPYTAYFANKSFIEENPEIIQKFVNAIYKGQQWVATHTAKEIAEILSPSFPEVDLKILETVINRYKEIDAWKTEPSMTEESFNKLQEIMINAGELTQTAPFSNIVNNTFSENLAK